MWYGTKKCYWSNGKKKAEELKINYFETSALIGPGIKETNCDGRGLNLSKNKKKNGKNDKDCC